MHLKLTIKQRTIIYSATLLIIIFTILFGVFLPSIRAILTVKKEINADLDIIEKKHQEIQNTKKSIQEIDSVLTRLEPFNQALLKPGQERLFITELEGLANKYGIEQHLVVNSVDRPNGYTGKGYTFSFSNQGTFLNHLQYLQALQQLPTILSFSALDFATKDIRGAIAPANNEPIITLIFTATVYASE